MLRKRGHHVDIASNGCLAVDAVRREQYDAVLMDIEMPELDGLAATQQIRRLPGGHELRIIGLSAHAMAGHREKGMAAGMNGYLTKPLKPRELFSAVEEWSMSEPTEREPAFTPMPVDLGQFRQVMHEAGVDDSADMILRLFMREAPERLRAIERDVETRDAEAIRKSAHAFKSSAVNIRAQSLANLLQLLESAGERGALDKAAGMLDQLRGELEAVLAYLNTALSEPGEQAEQV
jgi:CheY-like chemotaxis protein